VLGEAAMRPPTSIVPARGKLGVLLPGLGAVASTFVAGTMLVRRGLAVPIGSVSQLGTIRDRKRGDDRRARIRDALPLASLDDLVFGGWDIFADDAHAVAESAGVLSREHLALVKDELSRIVPMRGAFRPEFVPRLRGTHVKSTISRAALVDELRADIRSFREATGASRTVAIWCGSTEVQTRTSLVHQTIDDFERGLRTDDPSITNAQLYGWALLREGVPIANGTPTSMVDFPAAVALARSNGLPLAGKDFKTGQTMLKTAVAPALKARMLGIRGWFSTNILGNRDGEVLDDPEAFRSKESTKLGVLEQILEADQHPELYEGLHHKVRIEYYPPRGDAKEGWDSIDIDGWLGYPMQLKVNFLCRDSILAAPIVLDLALFLDLAHRAGLEGAQEWLGFYFKSPMSVLERAPEHDLFVQLASMKSVLQRLADEAGARAHESGERS
jgi:myo-inositol-1-phosphate synthase